MLKGDSLGWDCIATLLTIHIYTEILWFKKLPNVLTIKLM